MHKDLELLLKILNDKTGLCFENDRIPFFTSKVEQRITELKYNSCSEYLNHLILLDKDSSEFKTLINNLTINETFFFRHPSHFTVLQNFLLQEICRQNQRLKKPDKILRIWSAACSNGSEIYTIALVIYELSSFIKSCGGYDKIEIFGTDIDSEILRFAETGIYNERCVKAEMPVEYLNKYFITMDNGFYKIKDEIKKMVSFKNLNLVTDIYPTEIDIVFCRNVIYYFDLKMQKRIIKKIYNSMKRTGVLFLGGTETINCYEYFEICKFKNSFYFKKWSTDRRIYDDSINSNKRLRPSKKCAEPIVGIDNKSNTLYFSGVFADNCDPAKLMQLFYYSLGLFDQNKIEVKIFQETYRNINIDFSKIQWISNDILSEIKNWFNFLKNKNIRITVSCGKNENICNWLDKSNFKELCLIDNAGVLSSANVKENITNKRSFTEKKCIKNIENVPSHPKNINFNISVEKKNLNEEGNKTNTVTETSGGILFFIRKCDEDELLKLRLQINSCLNLKKKLTIDLRHAVYLNCEIFSIINEAQKSSANDELIHIIE